LIAKRLKKQNGSTVETDLQSEQNLKELFTVVLTRPIRMFAEPLVLFSDLFLVYQYSVYYLYFEAYQIIFQGKDLFLTFDAHNTNA
jgi:hypothetical protein